MKKRERLFFASFVLLSCAEPSRTAAPETPIAPPSEAIPRAEDGSSAITSDAGGAVSPTSDAGARVSEITRKEAIDVLFTPLGDGAAPPACEGEGDDAVRCLIDARYASDAESDQLARGIFDRTGSVFGVERAHVMNGGYRGMLHLVPVLPVGENRVHLARIVAALDDYGVFFGALQRKGNATIVYRWRSLAIRFFRSVHARTPSAYASGWTVAYNVDGSLNKAEDSVRETMFHEIFHLNDGAHATQSDDWSEKNLGATYDAIVSKCRASKAVTACLAKYAPNDTMVKGGTYYAFQPGNDVREYAAELAVRYYKEQRAALGFASAVKLSFKCTGQENASSWKKVVDEFFGGIDLTAACP